MGLLFMTQKMINDIRRKELGPVVKIKENEKELSPKSMKKAISTENFIKFQWSWTL